MLGQIIVGSAAGLIVTIIVGVWHLSGKLSKFEERMAGLGERVGKVESHLWR